MDVMDVVDRQLVFGHVQQQPLQRALGVILLHNASNPKVTVTSTP